MSNIPKARTILLKEIRPYLPVRSTARRRLFDVLHLMVRRPQHHRALGTRAKMTPLLRARILRFAATHPTWTQQRIAERYNVTNARVSEILHGKSK